MEDYFHAEAFAKIVNRSDHSGKRCATVGNQAFTLAPTPAGPVLFHLSQGRALARTRRHGSRNREQCAPLEQLLYGWLLAAQAVSNALALAGTLGRLRPPGAPLDILFLHDQRIALREVVLSNREPEGFFLLQRATSGVV